MAKLLIDDESRLWAGTKLGAVGRSVGESLTLAPAPSSGAPDGVGEYYVPRTGCAVGDSSTVAPFLQLLVPPDQPHRPRDAGISALFTPLVLWGESRPMYGLGGGRPPLCASEIELMTFAGAAGAALDRLARAQGHSRLGEGPGCEPDDVEDDEELRARCLRWVYAAGPEQAVALLVALYRAHRGEHAYPGRDG